MVRLPPYTAGITKLDFIQNIIPSLEDSLALKNYTPFAGNIACPINSSGYPELRHVMGDFVSVTFSEIDMDFNYLIGAHPHDAKDFYHFVPRLAEPKDASGVQLAPVLAIQVTLFPNLGVSIGFTNHHVAGDGATIVRFIRAWALLHKFGGHEQFLSKALIPFYGRSIIKNPYGQAMSIWEEKKKNNLEMRDIVTPQRKVRGKFTIRREDIEKLKILTLSRRRSTLTHVTSFTVTCAYVWTYLIKSEYVIREEIIDDNGMEFFLCAADCRTRLNPPLSQSYFEVIQKRMKDEEWILSSSWFKELDTIHWNRKLTVAGSPKHNLYATDFGWGSPAKYEIVSIHDDDGISMSLSKSKDCDGDLEIGLSLSKTRMNAFAAIFTHGLSFL
ncbi:hypothetical protein FXO38_28935 [Capsicum annuum]|nr:hypothetical protein FXO38_28935 [Capsicum annuum]KAF3664240.1 hypothetical protein FXO37_11599 [Capsicum annuum]